MTGPPRRAVVVDDDPDVRARLEGALRDSGRVEIVGDAADANQAIAVAAQQRPDLVLLALNLPGTDGLAALPRVRRVCPPDAVVIVMSALSTPPRSEVARREAVAVMDTVPRYGEFVEAVLELTRDAAAPTRPDELAARWQFPADLTSGALARQQLRRLLNAWHLADLLDAAELLATELINNAVVHAGSSVLVRVRHHHDALRVEVSDHGSGALHRPDTPVDETHGCGLRLVEALSTSWGTAVRGDTKTVWFELSAPPSR